MIKLKSRKKGVGVGGKGLGGGGGRQGLIKCPQCHSTRVQIWNSFYNVQWGVRVGEDHPTQANACNINVLSSDSASGSETP